MTSSSSRPEEGRLKAEPCCGEEVSLTVELQQTGSLKFVLKCHYEVSVMSSDGVELDAVI